MPQGSILGPILYLLYTVNVPISQNVVTAMFVDDTVMLTSRKDPAQVSRNLQNHLNNIIIWLTK